MITSLGVGFMPATWVKFVCCVGVNGWIILKIAGRAIPFVFFMLLVVLMLAFIPSISTVLLPEIYQ